jgi:hypothetical protein
MGGVPSKEDIHKTGTQCNYYDVYLYAQANNLRIEEKDDFLYLVPKTRYNSPTAVNIRVYKDYHDWAHQKFHFLERQSDRVIFLDGIEIISEQAAARRAQEQHSATASRLERDTRSLTGQDKLNKLNEAKSAYDSAIALNTAQAATYRNSREALQQQINQVQNQIQAEAHLATATRLAGEANNLSGQAKISKLNEAKQAYDSAIALNTAQVATYRNSRAAVQQQVTQVQNQLQAEGHITTATRLVGEANNLAGQAKIDLLNQAIQAYDRAIALNTAQAATYRNSRATVQQQITQAQNQIQAEAHVATATRLVGEARNLAGQAKLNRLSEARQAYDSAIALNTAQAATYRNSREALQQQINQVQNQIQAEAHVATATRLAGEANNLSGQAKISKLNEAKQAYDSAIALNTAQVATYRNSRTAVQQQVTQVQNQLQAEGHITTATRLVGEANNLAGQAKIDLLNQAIQAYDRAIALNTARKDEYALNRVSIEQQISLLKKEVAASALVEEALTRSDVGEKVELYRQVEALFPNTEVSAAIEMLDGARGLNGAYQYNEINRALLMVGEAIKVDPQYEWANSLFQTAQTRLSQAKEIVLHVQRTLSHDTGKITEIINSINVLNNGAHYPFIKAALEIVEMKNIMKKIKDASVTEQKKEYLKLLRQELGYAIAFRVNDKGIKRIKAKIKSVEEQMNFELSRDEIGEEENNIDLMQGNTMPNLLQQVEHQLGGHGSGDKYRLPYISNLFEEYYTSGLDNILDSRIEQLSTRSNYVAVVKNSLVGINDVSNIVRMTQSKSTILPLLIDSKLGSYHWVGLIINKDNDRLNIIYLDSENHAIPSILVSIINELNQVGFKKPISFTQMSLEQQRYNNCGPELIENFVYYLTGVRATQEAAIYLHSLLTENRLLDPVEYKLKIEENNKIIKFLSNSKLEIPYRFHEKNIMEEVDETFSLTNTEVERSKGDMDKPIVSSSVINEHNDEAFTVSDISGGGYIDVVSNHITLIDNQDLIVVLSASNSNTICVESSSSTGVSYTKLLTSSFGEEVDNNPSKFSSESSQNGAKNTNTAINNISPIASSSLIAIDILESASTLKYFANNILGISVDTQISNEGLSLIHFALGTTGALALGATFSVALPAAGISSAIYYVKVSTYSNMQNLASEDAFVSIGSQVTLSLASHCASKAFMPLEITSLAYDMFRSTSIAGMGYYEAHYCDKTKEQSSIEKIMPYITDSIAGLFVARSINMPGETGAVYILLTKQLLAGISTIVTTDYVTKAATNIFCDYFDCGNEISTSGNIDMHTEL